MSSTRSRRFTMPLKPSLVAGLSVAAACWSGSAFAAAPLVLACGATTNGLSTASDRKGGLLAASSVDLGWTTGTAPTTGGLAPAYVYKFPSWATVPGSGYVSYAVDGFQTARRVDYFRLQFQLPANVDLTQFAPQFVIRADNTVTNFVINGTSLAGTVPAIPQGGADPFGYGGFLAETPPIQFTAPSNWVAGLNTVVVTVASDPGYTGFSASVTGPVPCTAAVPTAGIVAVPTLSETTLILMSLLLAVAAAWRLSLRRNPKR